MKKSLFETLSPNQKALVAMAVLLDGREAGSFLALDSKDGELLSKAAEELAEHPPELRMPYVGTLLRTALKEIR